MQLSTNPIWKLNLANEWGLYTRTDYKLPVIATQDSKKEKEVKPKKKGPQTTTDSAFYFSKAKQENKGTVTCTPKGYGIIQAINQDKSIISVKVDGVIYEFDKQEVMNEVPLNVIFLKDSTKIEEIIYLPVNSTTNDLVERIENSIGDKEGDQIINCKIFFQGKELEKSDDTLEKLKIVPNSKFLVIHIPGKPMVVKRFTYSHQGWGVACGTNSEGIAFQTSKTIRLTGFGMYPIMNKEYCQGSAKVYQGDSNKSEAIYQEEVVVAKNPGDSDSIPCKVSFKRPILIKSGEFYSITINFQEGGNSHYGNDGKARMEGEGDVIFNFKNCTGANNGTSTSSGQIPEIHYFA